MLEILPVEAVELKVIILRAGSIYCIKTGNRINS